jgi:hypothetical protein
MLALVAAPALAKVGVTSATDGDPLGKPPQQNERVLRIGIDIQADEVVTTNATDRAHLVFLDGTSLTVGPNARVVVDKFVYDPNTKTGELALTASKGVFRLVGGKISKTSAITVATPSSTIGVRGGITIFSVSNVQTMAYLAFGQSLSMTGGGATQTTKVAGTQIVANFNGTPGNPTRGMGGLAGSMGELEGTNSGGSTSGGNPDQKSQQSGFSGQNSGQGPGSYNLPPTTTTTTTTSTTNTTTNAVNNTSNAVNPGVSPSNVRPITTTTSTTTTTTVDQTTSTRTIVTRGRFLQDQPYLPDSFNPTTLSADPNPQNNRALKPKGSTSQTSTTTTTTTTTNTTVGGVVTDSKSTSTSSSVVGPTLATITIPGSEGSGNSLVVPWLPGQFIQFSAQTSLGPASVLALVGANQDFFVYAFILPTTKFLLFGGTPTVKRDFPTVGVGAQQVTSLTGLGNLPFAPNNVAGDTGLQQAATVSPLYSVYTPNLNGARGGRSVPDALQVTISIAGTSTTQKSYMGVFIANYGTDRATRSIYTAGTFLDSYRLGASQPVGRGISNMATADTGAGNAVYGSTGQYQVYIPDKITTTHQRGEGSTTTRTPGAALDQAQANLPPTSYYPVTMATPVPDPSTLPADLGQKRTTQTLNGYVGGLIEAQNGNSFTTRVPNLLLSKPTDVSISTNAATNQAMATIVMRGLDGTLFSPTATLQLGGKSGPNGPVSAFIDDSRYAMVTQTNDRHRQSTVRVGERTVNLPNNSMLASYQTAPVALPNGVQPCTCEYLSWGFWSSHITYGNGYRAGQTDNINLGSYVVGQLTTAIQMPQTGTATFGGFMVGNVQTGGAAYVAGGNYTSAWNFANRAGSFNATFDGTGYRGAAIAQPGSGGTTFTGAFVGGRGIGTLTGSFFNAPGQPAQYQGGAFAIGNNNSAYQASGIFAGQRTGP